MPGPTIAVKLLGDVSALGKSFGEASSKASTAASNMHASFGHALDALNQTGVLGPFGTALSGVNDLIGQIGKNAGHIGIAMAGVGATIAGVGVALSAAGSKDKAANQQLKAAVDATGHSYEDYAKGIEQAIKHQEHFGNTAAQTQDALRSLTAATNDPAKALQFLSVASDLAAAKGIPLESAAVKIGKAYNGNVRALKEFGIQVVSSTKATAHLHTAQAAAEVADKSATAAKDRLSQMELIDATHKHHNASEAIALHNAQIKVVEAVAKARDAHLKLTIAQKDASGAAHANADNITKLGDKLKGQASAAANTFGGHLKAMKAQFEDTAATIGQKYGPALTGLGTIMAGVGASITTVRSITEAFSGAQKAQAAATDAVSAAEDAEAVSGWAALGPILLIVAAIAALVAIGYVLYRNWDTIWKAIKFAVAFVWDWIKANWPLLLGILLGPIALAAVLIYRYWHQILDGIQTVWRWIKAVWGDVVSFLTAPIAAAIHWIAGAWGTVTAAIGGVVSWIRAVWSTLYGALTGTISRAVGFIRGAWGVVTSAVSGVINTVTGLFNGLLSFLGGIPARISGIFTGAFDAVKNAASEAIGFVKSIWNAIATHTAIHIHHAMPGPIPDINFDTPQLIPSLAAGGLMTSDGLVYAHAGEVISPAPGAAAGPAVVVEHATFETEVDVELFMRRAAWVVRTQAV